MDLLEEKRDVESSYVVAQLEQYRRRVDVFISFTVEFRSSKGQRAQSGAKLGINPKSGFSTPIGIYAYPVQQIWHQIDLPTHRIPFGGERPNIFVFENKSPERVATGSRYKLEDLKNDMKRLRDLFPENKTIDEITTFEHAKLKPSALEDQKNGTWDTDLPYVTLEAEYVILYQNPKILQVLIKDRVFEIPTFYVDRIVQFDFDDASDYFIKNLFQQRYDTKYCRTPLQSLWTLTREMAEENPIKWTNILRQIYDGVVDDQGDGFIHTNEPTQAVFFNRKFLKVLDLIKNKGKNWKDSKNLLDEKIQKILEKARAFNNIIHEDLNISGMKLTELPDLSQYIVNGDFVCQDNYIRNLKGCPKIVKGDFAVQSCRIQTLEGFPKFVGGSILLNHNQLTSLDGLPETTFGRLNVYNNKLKSLKGVSKYILGGFDPTNNPLPKTEKYRPIYVGGEYEFDTEPWIGEKNVDDFPIMSPGNYVSESYDFQQRLEKRFKNFTLKMGNAKHARSVLSSDDIREFGHMMDFKVGDKVLPRDIFTDDNEDYFDNERKIGFWYPGTVGVIRQKNRLGSGDMEYQVSVGEFLYTARAFDLIKSTEDLDKYANIDLYKNDEKTVHESFNGMFNQILETIQRNTITSI